jgi:hypothetical protein
MDLDNLLKRFLDALHETVFRNVPGRDGCVVEVHAKQERVASDAEAELLGPRDDGASRFLASSDEARSTTIRPTAAALHSVSQISRAPSSLDWPRFRRGADCTFVASFPRAS